MKDWIRRWLGTPTLFDPAAMFDKLQEAHKQHISDLRVLIDKANEREAVLASMLREAVSQKQPQRVNPAQRTENRVQPAIDIEHLSDVTVFDEEADAAEVKRQEEATAELRELYEEQVAEGIHKP